jgi:phosphoethanolamine N-methyltransferase
MLRDIPVTGTRGLDVGCGIGGYDIELVRTHGAAEVTGIDLGAAVVAEARRRAEEAGLADRLAFRVVDGGPLPFDDDVFDFVFSKDTIADVPADAKPVLLREMFRVCRAGGRLILGDWFCSEAPYTEEMRAWATEGDETYEMQTLEGAARDLLDAGFTAVEREDRNEWFRGYARDEYERLRGPLFARFAEAFGEASARASVENARVRSLLADQGQLRPGHLRAVKPAR